MSPLTLAVSTFAHLVAAVVWLGGLAVLLLWVWPASRRTIEAQPALAAFMSLLRRRFTPWANFALAVLIVSGLAQMTANPNYGGVLDLSNVWSQALFVKHIAVMGMAVCSVLVQYGVAPALERTSLLLARQKATDADGARAAKLRAREVALTSVSLGLGALVLACSALMSAV